MTELFDKQRIKNLTTQARDAPLNGTSDCSFTPVPSIIHGKGSSSIM